MLKRVKTDILRQMSAQTERKKGQARQMQRKVRTFKCLETGKKGKEKLMTENRNCKGQNSRTKVRIGKGKTGQSNSRTEEKERTCMSIGNCEGKDKTNVQRGKGHTS